MTKNAKDHLCAIHYFDHREITILPKIICFELINTKDETNKNYFRVYETAVWAQTGLHSNN